jgi:hypothetical protein
MARHFYLEVREDPQPVRKTLDSHSKNAILALGLEEC